MDGLADLKQLMRGGRFAEAYRALEGARVPPTERRAANLLKAEVLEQLGRREESLALTTAIAATKGLSHAERATCEYVFARLCLEEGATDEAIEHLQRSIARATDANDLERLAWSQIRLFRVVGERSGPQAAAIVVAQARLTTTRLGDPQLSAALHVCVGELEAQRGLLQSAERHVNLGLDLLAAAPNVYLEILAENVRFIIGFFRQEFDRIRPIGLRALRLAEESGVTAMRGACLANLGNVFMVTGEFDTAADYLEQALALMPSRGDRTNAALDTLAEVRLHQNQLDECAQLFSRIDASIRVGRDRTLYAQRFSQLTRSHLMERRHRGDEALACAESALELARAAGDKYLAQLAVLRKADVLQEGACLAKSLDSLHDVTGRLSEEWPDLYAQYERILATILGRAGDSTSAGSHYERARRIYKTLKRVPDLIELHRSHTSWASTSATSSGQLDAPTESAASRATLQTVALMTALSSRPVLLAQEVLELLRSTDCVQQAELVFAPRNGHADMGRRELSPATAPTDRTAEQRWCLGDEGGQSVIVALLAKPDPESAATINALSLLLSKVRHFRQAQAEREERAALWPADEITAEDGRVLATGHMREMLSFARRIASTSVSVLITGESGTGKEVLARAIHAHSDHPGKPFVPFNCTAVPRELLESHLFGHRRGAFTGADRDHPGVIRTARGGTLFLDEIGDLGLDLQPKLLRFLESGEICPVGESTPFTVPVRVIAATNANLEGLVKEARFREDLFYRLNVIRLSIRPLRERRDEIPGLVSHFVTRAAEEFHKGRIQIADETMERLLLYAWPGNVRQLQNEIRRMVALADSNRVLVPADIAHDILKVTPKPTSLAAATGREITVPLTDKVRPTLARIEREMITIAIRDHRGRVDAAARSLGLSRKGFYLKRQRLGL